MTLKQFKLKRSLFLFLSSLTLFGELWFGYKIFSLLQGTPGFWMNWVFPILSGFFCFLVLFFLMVIISGPKSIGWGDLLLLDLKLFKRVCHTELGYFMMYVGNEGVYLYDQGIFRLKYLKKFSLEPEYLQSGIKEFLDDTYKEKVKEAREKEILRNKIKKVRDWDGFLDKVERRDFKIDELLK